MLVFNEGVPGAGKSYDAVAEHILPALAKGRTVYARLNGLNRLAISEHLGKPLSEIESTLHLVKSADVRDTFKAVRNEEGEFVIPEKFANALIVIDEVHEFYTSGRDKLPEDIEQFFAIQRHYGLDVVLITQWYKRMHTALRARIERKNVFQKLTVIGKKNSYRVTFWQTIAPDRYEKVGGVNRDYNPAIWKLYKGVADDDVQTEVYDSGGLNLWKSMLPKLLIGAALAVAGVVVLMRFFSGGAGLVKEDAVASSASTLPPSGPFQPDSVEAFAAQRAKDAGALGQVDKKAGGAVQGMTPEQAYVWNLSNEGRVRVAAILVGEGQDWGLIEWRPKNGEPFESLTTRQLAALGIEVRRMAYGFKLQAHGETIIATQWPVDQPIRPKDHTLYRLDQPGDTLTAPAIVSEANNAGLVSGSTLAVDGVAAYGAMRGY